MHRTEYPKGSELLDKKLLLLVSYPSRYYHSEHHLANRPLGVESKCYGQIIQGARFTSTVKMCLI